MSETPRLSPSVANTLLNRSPLHAWHYHRLLGGAQREATASMEDGSVLHHLMLANSNPDGIVIVDASDWRTKAAREARDAARLAGKTPVLANQHAELVASAKVIAGRIVKLGLDPTGWDTEKRFEWEADGVLCSGVVDAISGVSYEMKSTDDAHPLACRRSIEKYGYHVQAAAYREAAGLPVHFIFVEPEAPYDVTLINDIAELVEIGDRRWSRAKRTWKRCLAADEWPGAGGGKANRITASEYALSKDREDAENE